MKATTILLKFFNDFERVTGVRIKEMAFDSLARTRIGDEVYREVNTCFVTGTIPSPIFLSRDTLTFHGVNISEIKDPKESHVDLNDLISLTKAQKDSLVSMMGRIIDNGLEITEITWKKGGHLDVEAKPIVTPSVNLKKQP